MTNNITSPPLNGQNSFGTEDYRTAENMISRRSGYENDAREKLKHLHKHLLLDLEVSLEASALVTLGRQSISRLIYYYELYKKIVDIPGVICEFGVQHGATFANLLNIRGMLEPYNVSRKLIGFDTFEGFADVSPKDHPMLKKGDYSVPNKYEDVLEKILSIHEALSPVSHIKRFELIKGDASKTFQKWLDENPHALVSMAIFDMDVYKPTRDVLEKILPRLFKGSVLIFDELTCAINPGESIALQEILSVNNLSLKRFPHQSYCAWATWGD